MKIESLIRIIGGKLQNSPSILQIDEFHTSATKANHSCAFFDVNNSFDDVKLALENGAYAIISSSKHEILDEEIAWIHVENLELALTKLSRFFVQEKKLQIHVLPKIFFELLCFFRFQVKIKSLKQTIATAFRQIINASDETIFFAMQSDFIKSIYPNEHCTILRSTPEKVFEKSLFLSSFIYKEHFFHEIKLCSFFLPYLCGMFEYFEKLTLEYEFVTHAEFNHFYPQFVGENLQAKEFGTSSKVLIFEKDRELFLEELEFLENSNYKDSFIVSDFNKIYQLEKSPFRYALINAQKEDFDSILYRQNRQQLTLL